MEGEGEGRGGGRKPPGSWGGMGWVGAAVRGFWKVGEGVVLGLWMRFVCHG